MRKGAKQDVENDLKHKFNKYLKAINKLDCIKKQNKEGTIVLSDKDFYPPPDTRCYKSGVEDVCKTNNFSEYSQYFWEEYYDELYDE